MNDRCYYCNKTFDVKLLEVQHPWKEVQSPIKICAECTTKRLRKLDELRSFNIQFERFISEFRKIIDL